MPKDKRGREVDLLDRAKYNSEGAYHWRKYENNKLQRSRRDVVIEHFTTVEKNEGQDIIEIGCGDGLWIHLLTQKGYKVCGIDANETAVKLAHEEGVKSVTHSTVLDYEGTHDVVLLFDAFEHFEDPPACVKKLTDIAFKRIYLLNPLWASPRYHFDCYDTPKLVNLFKENWKLTHEELFREDKKGYKIKSFMKFERK
jgi:SAM-dependent methyltransferase